MTRVRGWQYIAALIGIAVIGVVIAIRSTQGKLDTADMAAYFPKRDALVAHINIAAIRNSGLLEKLVGSTVGEETEYKTFVDLTGFNYKRDLDEVMLNSAAGVHYSLLKGRFDWDKLKGYASQQSGGCEEEYCSVPGSTPGRVISFYPVNRNVMALASAPAGEAARDITRRAPEKLPFEVPTQPVWIYAPASVVRTQQGGPPGTRLFFRAIESAEQMVLSIGPSGDAFEVAMNVTCRTEQEAAVLKAQLEQITTLLQSLIRRENKTPAEADLSGILTAGSFQRESRSVLGKWPISKAFINSIGGS